MTPVLYRLGRACVRNRWLVIGLWVVVVLAVGSWAQTLGNATSDNYTLPGTGAQQAQDLLDRLYPSQKNGSSPIVFHTSTGTLTDEHLRPHMEAAFHALENAPHVQEAIDPLAKGGKFLGMLSEDETSAYITVILNQSPGDISQAEAEAILDEARMAIDGTGIEVAAGGVIGGVLSQPDPGGADRIGLIAAMVILAVVFGSLVAMFLPIVTALASLSIGLGTITILSNFIEIPTVAPTLATMIGLGVGIDYALFTVTRHRDHLREGMDVHESIARATATSGGAIVFAGGTVVIAITSLGLADIPLASRMGYATSIVVAIAVAAAITLLPALLAVIGPHVDAAKMPAFLSARHKDPADGMWAKWADRVGRHPWRSVSAALAILLPLTLPLFELELGSPDTEASPKENTARIAYEMLDHGFGPGANGPLLVAIELETPAHRSLAFADEKARAEELGRKLMALKRYGDNVKARLKARGRELKREGAELAADGAPLQVEQAELEAEGARLLAEKERLESQGARLLAEKERLQTEGARLQAQGEKLGAKLVHLGEKIAILETKIAGTADPVKKAELEAKLARTESEARRTLHRLERIEVAGKRLEAAGRRLAREGAHLEAQGRELARLGARLESRGIDLARKGAPLLERKQGLQRSAARLKREAHRQKLRGKVLGSRADDWIEEAKALKEWLTGEAKMAAGEEKGTDERLVALQDALEQVPGIASVSPVQVSESGRAAVITVNPTTSPSNPRTSELVEVLREQVIPEAVATDGTKAYVGGLTAAYDDLAEKISQKLPFVIATVISLSFILLMVAFRSVAIPIKAAVMNILSVTAAYGVLVAVFQRGWGLHLVGIPDAHTVPIVSFVPLMMFAVLFGLSMDYEVFLLSQIAEHHATGETNHDSVVHGLATSARVITAAALIMVSVFGSFILNEDPIIKQFGIGLSVAVALDATVIRILLVPATMALLGDANWWLPRWLGKLLPRIELEGKGYFHRIDAARERADAGQSPS